jgi:hypothetical protein
MIEKKHSTFEILDYIRRNCREYVFALALQKPASPQRNVSMALVGAATFLVAASMVV